MFPSPHPFILKTGVSKTSLKGCEQFIEIYVKGILWGIKCQGGWYRIISGFYWALNQNKWRGASGEDINQMKDITFDYKYCDWDDQNRNPNINNRDNLVWRPTNCHLALPLAEDLWIWMEIVHKNDKGAYSRHWQLSVRHGLVRFPYQVRWEPD